MHLTAEHFAIGDKVETKKGKKGVITHIHKKAGYLFIHDPGEGKTYHVSWGSVTKINGKAPGGVNPSVDQGKQDRQPATEAAKPEDWTDYNEGPLWGGKIHTSERDPRLKGWDDKKGYGACGVMAALVRKETGMDVASVGAAPKGTPLNSDKWFPHYVNLTADGAILDKTAADVPLQYRSVTRLPKHEMPELVNDKEIADMSAHLGGPALGKEHKTVAQIAEEGWGKGDTVHQRQDATDTGVGTPRHSSLP
jgi:hypothetical protein